MQTQWTHRLTTGMTERLSVRAALLWLSVALMLLGSSTAWLVDRSTFNDVELTGPVYRAIELHPDWLAVIILGGLVLALQYFLRPRFAWMLWLGLGIFVGWLALMGAASVCLGDPFFRGCAIMSTPMTVFPPIVGFLTLLGIWVALRPTVQPDKLEWLGRILSISLLSLAVANLALFVRVMQAPLIEMPVRWMGVGMPLIVAGSIVWAFVEWVVLLWPRWGIRRPEAG